MSEPKTPTLWVPMSSKLDLAVLGKLGEEANELGNICSRAIIQGIDERDPETGVPNRTTLWKEIADVSALSRLARQHFGLNLTTILQRSDAKLEMKQEWLDMLRKAGHN